jgi:hypothetical protein
VARLPSFCTTRLKRTPDVVVLAMDSSNAGAHEPGRRSESYDDATIEFFIERYGRTRQEFKETIAYLINNRERIRDAELERLEAETQKLIDKLKDIDREKLLEEIACFKDILILQKRLLRENGKKGHGRETKKARSRRPTKR